MSEMVIRDKNEAGLNVCLGAKFTILGAELNAVYEKVSDTDYSILVMPESAVSGSGITVGKMIDDIQCLLGNTKDPGQAPQLNTDELKNSIDSVTGGANADFKSINIKLNTVFLHIHHYTEANSPKTDTEYAFSLSLDMSHVLNKDIGFVNLNSVDISVWKTENKKILEQMALKSIQDYLAE